MGYESQEWRENNIRVGYTASRGDAWWKRVGETDDGEPNHFDGPVPLNVAADLLDSGAVQKVPVYYGVPCDASEAQDIAADGTPIRYVPSHASRSGILRRSTLDDHGVFKDGYTPHQFSDVLLDKVADLVAESKGDLGIGSVGLLKNGAVAWLSIDVPEGIDTAGGKIRPSLSAFASHDGSLSTTYKRTITRILCENTCAAGLGEAGSTFKVKHSRYSKLKLVDAREILDLIVDTGEAFNAEVERLVGTTVTDDQWRAFVNEISPLPEDEGRAKTLAVHKRSTLRELYDNDPRVAPWRGNAWGAIQAVNTYEHHFATVRGAERAERNQLDAITGKFDKVDAVSHKALSKVLVAV